MWRMSPQGPQPALEEEAAACEEEEELLVFAEKAGEVEDGCEEALPGVKAFSLVSAEEVPDEDCAAVLLLGRAELAALRKWDISVR